MRTKAMEKLARHMSAGSSMNPVSESLNSDIVAGMPSPSPPLAVPEDDGGLFNFGPPPNPAKLLFNLPEVWSDFKEGVEHA